MKKKHLSRLAILGIASGLLASQIEAATEQAEASISPEQIQKLLAKHACKGPSGCAGLVAESDKSDKPSKTTPPKEKHKCKGPSGCAGLVAERDVPTKATPSTDKRAGNLDYQSLSADEMAQKRAEAATNSQPQP